MTRLFDIVAARRFNIEGDWIEILIPVFVIIVYAISGILKMRSNLKEEGKREAGAEQPRYRPLDESGPEWEQPRGEAADQEAARLERMLEVKPMPRTEPSIRPRQAPAGTRLPAAHQERRTLDAFLATQAPKPLAERIAEARAKAEAIARAQASTQPQGPWPAERQETAQTRKPKVAAPAAHAEAVARTKPVQAAAPPQLPLPLLGDLTETDTLRRAVLYAEILGTPVAFRDMDV